MDEATPKKSLGQHWLHDENALETICRAGNLQADDSVLEIGPGTGTLTRKLSDKVQSVVAVEYDADLASKIAAEKLPNVEAINQDILKFDLSKMPPDYKVVANIPYYLTSKLIRMLSETTNRAERVVILVQKEVAQRVAASPGNMSLLSVSAQFYWEVSLGEVVPAQLFTPPPKVDSQILVMTRREAPLFSSIDDKQFFQVVKAGFAARRKTLLNSLSGGLRRDKGEVEQLIKAAGLKPTIRPQELSLQQWHEIYENTRESHVG